MVADEAIERVFPEIERIEDDDLRAGTMDAWATTVAETGTDDLAAVAWMPPVQRELDLPDETLVEHVRDVTRGSIDMAELLLERRGATLDLDFDTVVAGALLHDVSKLYEYDGLEDTPVHDLLVHPHYGVHVAARAGLPVEVLHVILAHTRRTSVEPATIEAEIVRRVDEIAASAIRLQAMDDLRDA